MAFPYSSIVRDSLRTAFKYRILWILGVFITEASIVFSFSREDFEKFSTTFNDLGGFEAFFGAGRPDTGLYWFVFSITIAVILLSIMSVVSKAGMISGIKDIEDKKLPLLKEKIVAGWRAVVPVILADVLFWVPNVLLVGLVVWAYFAGVNGLVLFFSILLFLYIVFVALFRHYTYCYIVLAKKSSWAAVVAGFKLLVARPKETIVVGLIKVGFVFAAFLLGAAATLLTTIPFILLVFLFSLVFTWHVSFVTIVVGSVVGVAVIFMVKAMKTQLLYSMLTKTYWELTKK